MSFFRFSIIIFVCTLFAGCHQTARVEGIPFARSFAYGWGLMDCRGKVIVLFRKLWANAFSGDKR